MLNTYDDYIKNYAYLSHVQCTGLMSGTAIRATI
jgi:hypothetical protein